MSTELVIIIPCSAEKQRGIYNAEGNLFTVAERYIGTFHRYARHHAERLAADRILVLSAARGIKGMDDVCPDYEMRIEDKDSVASTPGKIAHQALCGGLLDAGVTVVSFCPAAYTAVLALAIPGLVTPLAGSRGIGEQRGRIARLTREALMSPTYAPESQLDMFGASA